MSFKTVLLVLKRHDSPATKSTLDVYLVTWSVSNHWPNIVFVGVLLMNRDSTPLLISYKSSQIPHCALLLFHSVKAKATISMFLHYGDWGHALPAYI
jgi:hypothetical protein